MLRVSLQMTFGICLKTANAAFFKNKLDLIFECVPQVSDGDAVHPEWRRHAHRATPCLCLRAAQMIFMLGLFGYMNFLIVYKWCMDWNNSGGRAPPNLIDTLISIVLAPGSVKDPMFDGQAGLQVFLVLMVFLAVPAMLIPKPLILLYQHKRQVAMEQQSKRHSCVVARHPLCVCVSIPLSLALPLLIRGTCTPCVDCVCIDNCGRTSTCLSRASPLCRRWRVCPCSAAAANDRCSQPG